MANEQVASELPPLPSKPAHQALAPLEYLVNHRRGSITDPALFSAQQQQQHPLDQSSRHPSSTFSSRNGSSYSFPGANGHKTSGNLMSSNVDQTPDRGWTAQAAAAAPIAPDQTVNSPDPSSGRHSVGPDPRSGSSTFLPPPSSTGSKRKMSHDRQGFHYGADDPNGNQTLGNYSPHEGDGPSPKRRSSTFDTNNRIARLTLQDRRDSVESRSSAGGASLGGWGDRRDSAASMYSATSLSSSAGGYQSSASGEMGKSYSWSQPQQGGQAADTEMHETPRSFDFPQDPASGQSNHQFSLPPAPIIPTVRYSASAALARRISISESSLPSNGLKPRNRRGSRNPSSFSSAAESSTSPDSSATASVSPVAQMNPPPPANAEGQTAVASPTSYGDGGEQAPDLQTTSAAGSRKDTPYSRSPELRVSHKMAERKRRKEMKDLFDELRDQLPAERGMKASKWEILSKAVDYIAQLKVAYTEMSSELEHLRGELDHRSAQPGMPPPLRRPDFPGQPQVHDLASEPGTPVSVVSPLASPMNGANAGAGSATYGDRPASAQSRRHSAARSPSTSTHPLQAQLTGGTAGSPMSHSPFQSHHQTPTPQQLSNPLPHQVTGASSS